MRVKTMQRNANNLSSPRKNNHKCPVSSVSAKKSYLDRKSVV